MWLCTLMDLLCTMVQVSSEKTKCLRGCGCGVVNMSLPEEIVTELYTLQSYYFAQ